LVELSKIPQLLDQFAKKVAPALGGPSSEGFAIAIFTFYSINGFLIVYLATRAYMESGLELLKRKEIDKLNAKELLKRKEIDEMNAERDKFREALNKNGLALYNQGKYNDAIQAYEMAIEIDPKFAETWHNKGVALDELGRPDEAKAAHDKAKELGYADKS